MTSSLIPVVEFHVTAVREMDLCGLLSCVTTESRSAIAWEQSVWVRGLGMRAENGTAEPKRGLFLYAT